MIIFNETSNFLQFSRQTHVLHCCKCLILQSCSLPDVDQKVQQQAAGVECSARIIETIFQNHSKIRSGKPYIIYLPIICNVFSHSLLNVISYNLFSTVLWVNYPIWPANKRMIICTNKSTSQWPNIVFNSFLVCWVEQSKLSEWSRF